MSFSLHIGRFWRGAGELIVGQNNPRIDDDNKTESPTLRGLAI
jgi:hypothetical protein